MAMRAVTLDDMMEFIKKHVIPSGMTMADVPAEEIMTGWEKYGLTKLIDEEVQNGGSELEIFCRLLIRDGISPEEADALSEEVRARMT